MGHLAGSGEPATLDRWVLSSSFMLGTEIASFSKDFIFK